MSAANAAVSVKSKKPIDVVALFPQVADIKNEKLKTAVIAVWQELWAMSPWTDLATVPTSPEVAYPTLPHNQCIVEMALLVADCFERWHKVKVDRDHLIAVAVLQDASKVIEYVPGPDGKCTLSDLGKTYPHAFWVGHIAIKHGIPDNIVHGLLTHTPQAAKFPTTMEGKILYYLDQLDVIAIHKDRWRKELFITK